MHHARLDINILDLWLFGSGRGEGAHIDSTPLLDAKGLPYVTGRAVKGLLRDAARELLLLQSPGEQQGSERVTARLGPGEEHGQTRHNTQPGRLQFTDARLPAALANALCANRQTIKGLFHDIRATAIDDSTGTASAHTLRSIRAVVPMQLQAELSSSAAEDFVLIRQAAHLVTALGAHRSRGMGRCACSLHTTTPTSSHALT